MDYSILNVLMLSILGWSQITATFTRNWHDQVSTLHYYGQNTVQRFLTVDEHHICILSFVISIVIGHVLHKQLCEFNHKPGDVMQVDWAGTTIQYQDSVTGEVYDAYIFASVLPCSCYAYVEACDDMKTTNWLLCHIYAYNFFGGVTRLLIPDNLKTGVIKNTQYDTVLNLSYEELSEYYGRCPCKS